MMLWLAWHVVNSRISPLTPYASHTRSRSRSRSRSCSCSCSCTRCCSCSCSCSLAVTHARTHARTHTHSEGRLTYSFPYMTRMRLQAHILSIGCLLTHEVHKAHNVCVCVVVGGGEEEQGKYATDERRIDEACSCSTCRNHTRAYLCHLLRAHEPVALQLLTVSLAPSPSPL